uniref:CD48 molecule n=1 Tax=Catagonus wagneri TaxID=51154 RepID=A0A8C3WQ17_9CETA
MYSRSLECCLALGLLQLPHLFLAIGIQGGSEYSEFVISGGNVSLQISDLPKNYKSLTWFYTTDQKIVEWESGELKYFDTKFKGRTRLDLQTGALHIQNVQKEDKSTYRLKVDADTSSEKNWVITLMVLDPVPKPVITIRKTEEMNNSCYLILSCVIQDQDVTYTWYEESGPFPKELQNSKLEITLVPQNYSRFYTCQVSNPVSSQNDTVYFASFCHPALSSGIAWTAPWLVIMVATVLGLLWT